MAPRCTPVRGLGLAACLQLPSADLSSPSGGLQGQLQLHELSAWRALDGTCQRQCSGFGGIQGYCVSHVSPAGGSSLSLVRTA